MGMVTEQMDALPKPDELLALHGVTTELFGMLRRWFSVPLTITLNLVEVDSAVSELGDPVLIAAMAMRKLQALNLLSTPGVRTTTDVVVTIVQDLDRALVQAPNMRLNLAAAATDWDAALAALDDIDMAAVEMPSDVEDEDPEATRFRELHQMLHDALFAVMRASEDQIRYFE